MNTLNVNLIVQSRAREQNPDTSSHEETRLHHLKLHADRTAHAFWVLTFKTEKTLYNYIEILASSHVNHIYLEKYER
jgi:hypothetical protein